MSFKPRLSLDKYEQVVVLTCGFDDGAWGMDTDRFVPSTKTWLSLPMIPYPCIEGDAVCGGILYVVGAKKDASKAMCCFNPKHKRWSTYDIVLNRAEYSVTCFNEELYVIGGVASRNDAEIYNPVLDEWRTAASMGTGHAGHSAVVLQEHIYVIAGYHYDSEVCLDSVECYNPLTDDWSRISSISKARMCAAVETVCEKIIVVGGFDDWVARTIEPSCEIFDPNTNQWNLVSSPGILRPYCSAVCINNIVYLFGGESDTDFWKTVECFDIKRNKWYEILVQACMHPC